SAPLSLLLSPPSATGAKHDHSRRPLTPKPSLRVWPLLSHTGSPLARDHLEARQVAQGRGTGCFAREQIEAGVMPRAADRAVDDEPLGQRPTVVRARGAHREHLGSALHEDHCLAADMTEQRHAVLNIRDGNAGSEIRSARRRWLAHVGSSPSLAAALV